ncbi:MAG: SRPBCC family protein [Saprospiraceae bacterium]|nr:SRPBCC family protein [Saprospiraceae bacterium]
MAEKGFDLKKEITINVPALALWEIIGPGFTDVYRWSSNVDHAEGRGKPEFHGAECSERFCNVNVKGFSKISEKLTKYDEDDMSLAYEILDGMPGFITKACNEWTVVPLGRKQSKLVMEATFRSKGIMGAVMNGMMKKKMNDTLETVLNDAKIFAETGKVSEAKEKRLKQLRKKQLEVA